MIAALGLALLACGPAQTAPAFEVAKKMVGGVWTGKLGEMTIEFRFKLEQNGMLVHGYGQGKKGKETIVTMDSCMGLESGGKRIYYLDRHNADTVYFGHITLEGPDLVFKFKGLVGDAGEYESREKFEGADTYTFRMWANKDGKLVDIHLATSLHRQKG